MTMARSSCCLSRSASAPLLSTFCCKQLWQDTPFVACLRSIHCCSETTVDVIAPFCPSVCPSVHPSICLSVCLTGVSVCVCVGAGNYCHRLSHNCLQRLFFFSQEAASKPQQCDSYLRLHHVSGCGLHFPVYLQHLSVQPGLERSRYTVSTCMPCRSSKYVSF